MALPAFFSILQDPYGPQIVSGCVVMLKLTLAVFVLGYGLGILLAVVREIPSRGLQWAVNSFVAYHRNVPMVVQLFVWYFGVPQLLPASWQTWVYARNGEFIFAWLGLGIGMGAYISEDLRSGIRSVARAQKDAAISLGFNYLSAMRWVVLPQALRAAAPAIVNQSLIFFKATSLTMTIGLAELTYETKAIADATYRTFELFAVTSVIYVAVSTVIMSIGAHFERSARRGAR